jgi:CHAT domain-containing protein
VATNGPLDYVPPAALLADIPPKLGSGFDLRSAHWMIRDHSFVRTTSINAFVATKRLSKTKRASLDYLGVGDPVLAARSPATLSGGEFAVRGSVRVESGALPSLPELPETSEELERVASLFDPSKRHILRREAASEEEFRLQPLSEFDVLHFATHALVKEEQPGLQEPSLVLTPNPEGDALNDGLLTSSQIAALPLKARLVVLSACNSAKYEPSVIDNGYPGPVDIVCHSWRSLDGGVAMANRKFAHEGLDHRCLSGRTRPRKRRDRRCFGYCGTEAS